MRSRFLSTLLFLSTLCAGSLVSTISAAPPPSESVFPGNTKGWISVQDIDQFHNGFSKSQIGELVTDPLMQPFIKDMQEVVKQKLNITGDKLGIDPHDLEHLYAGELAIGLIQPNAKDVNSHALVMTLDVTGKTDEALAFMADMEKGLIERKAVKEIKKVGEVKVTQFTLPLKPGEKLPEVVLLALHGDLLFAADHLETLAGMLGRVANPDSADSLKKVPGFIAVMEKVSAETKSSPQPIAGNPEFRWFIEPLGFAEAYRASNGGRKKKGADPITVLRKNGFGDLRGIGGFVHLATERQEALYRTFLFAPMVREAKAGAKKVLPAAGMSEFPNSEGWHVQPWVPHGVSAYLTFNWKMAKAFDHFGALFDGFTEQGTFDEILLGMETDPTGPMINIRKEIIALLGERVTLISDYRAPIDIRSERILVAFELKDGKEGEAAALAAIRKLMKAEPGARKTEAEGHELWEIHDHVEEAELPDLHIDGPGFVVFEPGTAKGEAKADAAPKAEEKVAAAPAPAGVVIAVAHGCIFVGTHADFMVEVLKERADEARLSKSRDFQQVEAELGKLGCDNESFRCFTRTDEAYRPTFELLRKGDLPKAETVLARGLNQLFTGGKKGEVRKALVDGKNMPEFEKIRHHLGPAGFYAHTEPDGWFVTGLLLRQSAEAVAKKE